MIWCYQNAKSLPQHLQSWILLRVRFESPLCELPGFRVVNTITLDFMHGPVLGVGKRLLRLILGKSNSAIGTKYAFDKERTQEELKKQAEANSKLAFEVNKPAKKGISHDLEQIQLPKDSPALVALFGKSKRSFTGIYLNLAHTHITQTVAIVRR